VAANGYDMNVRRSIAVRERVVRAQMNVFHSEVGLGTSLITTSGDRCGPVDAICHAGFWNR